MAAEGPEPKAFSSWEEAFQYPIPAVRGMERQLRRDIDSNKEKLRTLVGASYRDLLGTAESIIEMNDQMHNVETHMSEIGQKCNTRLLEKKGSNFHAWQEEVIGPDSARYALASQLSVLRSCPDVILRLLRTGGSVLLAAKVLVISRLLHTKLSKRQSPPPFLDTLRNRLAALRRRLLARIDRRFKLLDDSKDALMEAMCAFALATSSSPTDVVRHFHHLRLEAMAEYMGQGTGKQDSMLQALRLYVKTLRDTQALVPGQLAKALERIKMVSILKSEDLSALMDLNLDVHERWLGDDIKTFTPYIRHDDLNRAEAEKLLKQWARLAVSTFLAGLKSRIQDVQDPVRLMQLRKEVLDLWLSQQRHSFGGDSAETLDGLRDVFNDQSVKIIRARAASLERISASIERTIRAWREGESDITLSLWGPSMIAMETTNGGKRFCEHVADRLSGKNEPLRKVSLEYGQWLDGISAIEGTIKNLRNTKWEDVMEDADDEDDLLDDNQVLLSEDDPRLLQEELAAALADAYTRLQESLDPSNVDTDPPVSGQKAVLLLRVWRDIRSRLPNSYQSFSLGLESMSELVTAVVEAALETPLRLCSRRLTKTGKSGGLIARNLWEGVPELPVLPSPWAYRLLLEVVQSMTELGTDVWSPRLSKTLKQMLARELADVLSQASATPGAREKKVVAQANGHINGEASGEEAEKEKEKASEDDGLESTSHEKDGREGPKETETKINGTHLNGESVAVENDKHNEVAAKDRDTQRLFDVLYLMHASKAPSSADGDEEDTQSLSSMRAALEKKLDLGTKTTERLRKDAGEYWKRTKLLFALLQ